MSLGNVLVTARSVSDCDAAMKRMRAAGCEVFVEESPQPFDEDRLLGMVADKHALVFTMEPTTARLIDAAPDLKLIARPGVGFDTVDIDACNRRGIPVTVAVGCNHESVADFAIGLLILVARQMLEPIMASRERRWERRVGGEVRGKTLTVVGLGRIGRALVRRAAGFDLRVLVVAPHPDMDFASQHGVQYVDFETGLAEADFVSLHVPLMPATANMINRDTIALMKPGAILINTARGGLVDEEALAEAVAAGRLGGAGVDVLCEQGPGTRSPLIGVPNVIVTPHMAASSREAMERVALSVADNVVRTLSGERPHDVVNPGIYAD